MDELSQKARALIDFAQLSDEPSEEDRLRVRSNVLVRVGGAAAITAALAAGNSGTAAAAGSAASGSSLFGSALLKIGAAIALVSGLTTTAYVALKSPNGSGPQTSAVVATAAPTPQPAVKEVPVAAPVEVAREAETSSAPPLIKERSARVNTRKTTPDLDTEVALLRQADSALRRGDSKAALAALATHARDFPRGALAQEREGVRAIALCRGGRMSEGMAQAQRFVTNAPKSPLGSRIRSACFSDK